MSLIRYDLHTHTTCSDGSSTPEELLLEAKRAGLSGLAITDHDTVAAYPVAIPLATELGLRLGIGVEYSAFHLGHSVHILGYDFDLEAKGIHDLCSRHKERRRERNRKILAKLREHKIAIEEEELASYPNPGRPHIAFLMMQKGIISSIKEGFDLFLGENKSCYVAGEEIAALETIEVLHAAGGKAFLAHPHLLPRKAPLASILSLPFDGIECYYGISLPHGPWVSIAKERGWLVSGGSDYHGKTKPQGRLGSSFVEGEAFELIFNSNACSKSRRCAIKRLR